MSNDADEEGRALGRFFARKRPPFGVHLDPLRSALAALTGVAVAILQFTDAGRQFVRNLFATPKSNTLGELLGWPPIFWTARVVVLIVLAGLGVIFFLYAARFFRPRNMWKLMHGPLPTFTEAGVKAEVAGQKFEATAKLADVAEAVELGTQALSDTLEQDELRDKQIAALEVRLREMEQSTDALYSAVHYLLGGNDDGEQRGRRGQGT